MTAARMHAGDGRRARRRPHSLGRVLLEFLGSMNLAITLLVVVAIASVIGSILQQDQSWAAYLSKFGPFWFEVFRVLGLYDVYSAPWFMALLAFLVLSTSFCVYRHTPMMWKEMTRFRERQGDAALRACRDRLELSSALPPEQVQRLAAGVMLQHGYRVRAREERDGRRILAGMRGAGNRLGYLFTHVAVVVICVGGLIDANPHLLWLDWTGQLRIETRNDIPLAELHADSRLPAGTSAFRGTISIPEGGAARAVYLDRGEGYVAQELPFTIEVEAFRSSYWHNGNPRAYESDLIIHDPMLDEPLRQTIAVNHPLVYRGYSIYQASYSDGGTGLNLRLWPLGSRADAPVTTATSVHADLPLRIGEQSYMLEMLDFEAQNRRPNHEDAEGAPLDAGPSFIYRLRGATGEAREYRNFMQAIPADGRWYFLSGMRRSQAEDYTYLYIPADRTQTLGRFADFLGRLQHAERRADAAERAIGQLFAADDVMGASLAPYLAASAERLVSRFLDGGPPAVEAAVRTLVLSAGLEGDAAGLVANLLQDALHATLAESYADTLLAEGYAAEQVRDGMGEWDRRFFSDAMEALMVLPAYGSPVFPELLGYEHRQATGLQITRSPGQGVVYAGSLMLVVGIFLMFYVSQRRVWVRLTTGANGGTELLMGARTQRRTPEFAREFNELSERLGQRLGATAAPQASRKPTA